MLDIGWTEMAFIAVIALVVIGPKDLPKALRTVSHYVRKARSMAREFQSGLDDIAREADLDGVKDQITGGVDFDIGGDIQKTIDPTGEIDDALDISDELDALDADTPAVAPDDLPEPPGSDFVPPEEDDPGEPDGSEAAEKADEEATEKATGEAAGEATGDAADPAASDPGDAATASGTDDTAGRKQEASV